MNTVNQTHAPADCRAAATMLFGCIQSMGSRETNPVLELLGPVGRIREHQKLPEGSLRFGGADWRAYYHCHASGVEHGHFHVFARVPRRQTDAAERWTHVIGLAMDGEGQPVRWFVVNRWVTDSTWLAAGEIDTLLNNLPPGSGLGLVEQWLLAMIGLYRDEIAALLITRDRRLAELAAGGSRKDLLEDRKLSALAECPVALLEKLRQVLAGGARDPRQAS